MKTVTLRNFDSTIAVNIKVDIFARNSELLTAGFDTRFTHMEIGDGYKKDDAAIALIGQIQETEQNWQGLIALAQATPGIGLFLSDMNETINSTLSAQSETVSLVGTSGLLDITVDGVDYLATFNTDAETTADDFVTSHAAALSTAGITVTHATADGVLLFTADVDGVPFSLVVNKVIAVDTVSVTGTSGTADVTINGIDYVATFDTNLTDTAANFVTDHAAQILIDHKIVVTSAVADIILTHTVGGEAITSAIANVTGDLAGSSADTTDPGDLDGTRATVTLNQSGTGEITVVAP